MKHSIAIRLILGLATTAAAAADKAVPVQALKLAPLSVDECVVWQREASFAASVASHDAAAFRSHLHADAVFIGGRGEVTRGAQAVTESWTAIIAGEQIRLGWHPREVTIAGAPAVALSRGPYWMELPQPDGASKYMTGQFISTWVRDDAGEWHVLFDGGGGNQPQAASAAEVDALRAGWSKACPGT